MEPEETRAWPVDRPGVVILEEVDSDLLGCRLDCIATSDQATIIFRATVLRRYQTMETLLEGDSLEQLSLAAMLRRWTSHIQRTRMILSLGLCVERLVVSFSRVQLSYVDLM